MVLTRTAVLALAAGTDMFTVTAPAARAAACSNATLNRRFDYSYTFVNGGGSYSADGVYTFDGKNRVSGTSIAVGAGVVRHFSASGTFAVGSGCQVNINLIEYENGVQYDTQTLSGTILDGGTKINAIQPEFNGGAPVVGILVVFDAIR